MTLFKLKSCVSNRAVLALPLFLFFLMGSVVPTACAADKLSRQLWDAVTYLKSVPEIAWIEIEKRNIIIGWSGYPSKFSAINKTAAKKVSRKVRTEVRIYSVKQEQKGWRPGKDAPAHLCHSLGQKGRVKFSNCR